MRTAKTLIRLGGCTGWSVSSLGAMAILLALSCGGSCIPCSWVPSIKSESECGSRSRWFDSGPAKYRLMKLIMHIFSLIEKGSCQMFNLSAQIVWLQTYYDWNILLRSEIWKLCEGLYGTSKLFHLFWAKLSVMWDQIGTSLVRFPEP